MGTTDPFETDETRAAAEHARGAAEPRERPDWLVGAEEGVDAEVERRHREDSGTPEAPTLRRPEAPDDDLPPRPLPAAPRLHLVPPPPDAPASRGPGARAPAAPAKPEAWKAAASSLPTLRVVQGNAAPAKPARPAPARDPDEERDPLADFPDDGPAAAAPAAARPAPIRVAAPHEPFWILALESLRSDRRVQLLAVLVAVLIGVVLFWPRGERGVGLGEIRRHPDHWDGRSVRVSGRVGEVFPVGGGYAFYLLQGRDTLVVFTRSRTPVEDQRISLGGSISTGYLDGIPRLALFEDTR